MTISIRVIGIGVGNAEQVTIQAINVLNTCNAIIIPTKGQEKEYLARARQEICDRYITGNPPRILRSRMPERRASGDYSDSVKDWHLAIAAIYEDILLSEIAEGDTVGFLVWGDPMLFDSTLRIIEIIRSQGRIDFDIEVVPGISSLQALCAAHRIPLNAIGKPIEITTGRCLANGWPDGVDDVAVLMDGQSAYATVSDETAIIHWGAYLGSEMEITISGRLCDVGPQIAEARAKARAEMGWIMDTYVIRRTSSALNR